MKKGNIESLGGNQNKAGVAESSMAVPGNCYLVHTEDGGSRIILKEKWAMLMLQGESDVTGKEIIQSSQESSGAGEIDHVENEDEMGIDNIMVGT